MVRSLGPAMRWRASLRNWRVTMWMLSWLRCAAECSAARGQSLPCQRGGPSGAGPCSVEVLHPPRGVDAGCWCWISCVSAHREPQGSFRLPSAHRACTGRHCCVREFVCSKSVCEAVTRYLAGTQLTWSWKTCGGRPGTRDSGCEAVLLFRRSLPGTLLPVEASLSCVR